MSDQDYRESLSLDVSNFLGGLQAAQVALGTFAATIAEQVIGGLTHMAEEFVTTARDVGKSVEALENLSAATGVSQKNLTTLESVAKVSGASMEGLASVMRIMSMRMQEADRGNVDMQARLKLLGITSRDAWTALMQVSDTLTKYAGDTNRLAISTEVLGRGFAQILPAIKDGSKAFKEAEDRAVYMGTAFDYFSDGKISKMDDAFDKLGLAVEGFWKNLIGALAPAITTVVDALTELIVSVSELTGALSFKDAMMAQWIRFSTLLKEIGVNAMGILAGQVFSEAGRNAMRAEIDAIEAEAKARLMELRRNSFTPEPEGEKKPSIGVPFDSKQAIKSAEEELKLEQETANAIQKMNKARTEFEKAQIAERLAYHKITNEEAASYTAVANQQETASLVQSLLVQLSQLSVFHQKRLALGFGTKQELETYEKEYAAQSLKITAELEAARVKGYTQTVQERVKVYDAERKDDKQALDDAVKLNEAKVAVLQANYGTVAQIAAAQIAVLHAQMELEIQAAEAAGRSDVAIKMKYGAQIIAENRIVSDSFSEGWHRALYKYVNDTNSMMNMMTDMVRNAAQSMQSAMSSFFFDVMQGKIATLKELFASLNQFMQRIIADTLAHILTAKLMESALALFKTPSTATEGAGLTAAAAALSGAATETAAASVTLDTSAGLLTEASVSLDFSGMGLDEASVALEAVSLSLDAAGATLIAAASDLEVAATMLAVANAASFAAVGANEGGSIQRFEMGGPVQKFSLGGPVMPEPQRFALGGPVMSNGDSVPAMLTPGEFVVSRQGVDALNRINQGITPSGGGSGDVTVNIVGSGQDQKPTVNVHRQLSAMVVDIIWANVRQNGSLRQLMHT